MTSDYFKIEIDGQQFRKNYLVYVVKLTNSEHGEYFYVGQTGDRNYLTARPAFRRLAGHFSDQGNSTENQIYRYIAVKILGIESAKEKKSFDQKTKDSVTQFLTGSKIEMFVHPIAKYLSTSNIEDHKANRQHSEKIENELINYFIEKYGRVKILNEKYTKTDSTNRDKLISDILNHINKA